MLQPGVKTPTLWKKTQTVASSKPSPKKVISVFVFPFDGSLNTKSISAHECNKNPINPSSKQNNNVK